ncbi:MAG: hypothetical protein Q8R92_16740 [Deltaproteobacteria bacterium]|nr:hypothetical protein [Deltaproteobacteria bacterium]
MADTFWSVVHGEQDDSQVTTDTSTSGEAIELRIETGTGMTKQEMLNGIEAIRNYIEKGDAPA